MIFTKSSLVVVAAFDAVKKVDYVIGNKSCCFCQRIDNIRI